MHGLRQGPARRHTAAQEKIVRRPRLRPAQNLEPQLPTPKQIMDVVMLHEPLKERAESKT